MNTPRYDVVVVGAGGGGAVLSLALAQRGIRVCVVERHTGTTPLVRVETIQPNGQAILQRLGILEFLGPEATQAVQRFHFIQVGGDRLCTVDYALLPPPWNYALVALSGKVSELILRKLEVQPTARVHYGMEFQGLIRRDGAVAGVVVRDAQKKATEIEANVVVGADGARSLVRQALGIKTDVHHYRHGYVMTVLPRPDHMQDEARYYVGRGELLGLFPAPGERALMLYMMKSAGMEEFKARGLTAFKARMVSIDNHMLKPVATLTSWDQVGFLPCTRIRADRWVADGAVLIGDAAHAMNPHASQGRMQAMMDAMALADVIAKCRENGDWSSSALSVYENARRPQVTMLQQLADEQTTFWNAGDAVRCFLRNRVFRGIDRNKRLRYQVLTATAGWRTTPPLGWRDRLMAVGLLPDPHANEIPISESP
jgi:monooxygenase